MAAGLGLSVVAWEPLAGGVLSGKFTAGAPPTGPIRVAAESVGDRERKVAVLVTEIAAELGVSPAQVAIAWIIARSPALHPIIGARRLDQLVDDLGAAQIVLPAEVCDRLDTATAIELGFPAEFIAGTASWVYGEAGKLVDGWRGPERYAAEVIGLRYSMAPRCPRCDHRAVLTLTGANRLVKASGRQLEPFRCRDEHGWHVRHPGIEGGGKSPRRGGR
jgi:aldo/keto reductase family protein